jgi:hypothetical protein
MAKNSAVERFYYEGRRSFYKVERRNKYFHILSNPYSTNSFRGKEWQRGYDSCYFENLQRLQNGK